VAKSTRTALVLRPQVHPPASIVRIAKMVESIGSLQFSNIFIPDIPGGYESIAKAAAALGVTEKLKIGSGVIRLLEHDDSTLLRRIETVQSTSGNRFVLGVGTGAPGSDPARTIDAMLAKLEKTRSEFGRRTGDPQATMPETYIATLKARIAERVAGHSRGILLNFCSADYAGRIITRLLEKGHSEVDFACYIKVFYSTDQTTADSLLIQEFANYNSLSQYHEMFARDGVAQAIEHAHESIKGNKRQPAIPESLKQISLSNPGTPELRDLVSRFREVGVTLPCIYPYFPREADQEYKDETIKRIVQSGV